MSASRPLLAWLASAAIAVGGIVAIPVPSSATAVAPPIPADFAYLVFEHCRRIHTPELQIGYELTGDGNRRVHLYVVTETGDWAGPISDSRPEHVLVEGCLDAFVIEPEPSYHQPASYELRIALRWQELFATRCVAHRGVGIGQHEGPLSALYGAYADGALELAEALEIRRACPPVPPFLASAGLGW